MLTPTASLPTISLQTSLDSLVEMDLSALSAQAQADLLRELDRATSKISAVRLRLLAVAVKRGTARASGAADTGQWAATVTNSDQAAAQRQVGLAAALSERSATARALAQGAMSTEHAAVIVGATRRLPDTVTEAQRDEVEVDLVAKAAKLPPTALRRVARRALAAIEPDERKVDAHENAVVADEESLARGKTRLSLHDNVDGTVTGHFTVPMLHGHLLRKVLEAMTAPRRGRLGASPAQVGHHVGLRTDWDHARGSAFCELLEHLPTDHLHPKTAATIVVTIDEEQLRGRLRAAGLDTGEAVSVGEARRLACNAGIIPAVLGGRSLPLDLGLLKRLFSEAQRIAAGLVHHTCAADGCERPYSWCELHHRTPWSKGGRTDLEDAVPLCHFHHRRIHDDGFLHRYLPDGSIRFRRRT